MICSLCEQYGDRSTMVGGHGEYAHPGCIEERERRRRERDAQSENARLRARVRELETQLAVTAPRERRDPHDPDGGEDDVRCPNGGRLIR